MKNTFNVASCVDRMPLQDHMDHCGTILNRGFRTEDCPVELTEFYSCEDKLSDIIKKDAQTIPCLKALGNKINFPLKSYCKVTCGQCGILFYIKII